MDGYTFRLINTALDIAQSPEFCQLEHKIERLKVMGRDYLKAHDRPKACEPEVVSERDMSRMLLLLMDRQLELDAASLPLLGVIYRLYADNLTLQQQIKDLQASKEETSN